MIKKSSILKVLESMPERVSIDELMEKLILVEKVDRGLEQIRRGETLTHEEVKSRFSRWLT